MSTSITKAMVLAAGLGTRMRPLTDAMPKPMVPFKGKPLVDHVLDRLGDAGIKEAVVNVHYFADLLEAHVKARKGKPKITVSDERDALLDTGGGVVRALPHFKKPFIIHNSDCVWIEGLSSNIARMLEAWDPATMDSLMLVTLGATSIGYDGHGDFEMDPIGRLKRRREGIEAPFAFTGVSIAHPRLFEGAPQGRFSLNVLWDRAIENGRLFGIRLDGTWMHIGTPEALHDAEQWIDRSNRI